MEIKMRGLICPISFQRVNENVVRSTALMIALLGILYIVTASPYIILLLSVDFYIRAFTTLKYSPLSWLSTQINHWLNLPVIMTDKAKKVFSARIGFLFTLAILIFYFLHPLSSLVVTAILISFALLESLLNICVGCMVYTYFVFPFFNPATK
jgi:hypothetical protein